MYQHCLVEQVKFDHPNQYGVMVEEARHKAGSLVDKPFNWVHRDPTEGREVDTLMMLCVTIFKEVVTDIREPCRVPRVHSPMNDVEVAIPPGWHQEHPRAKH